MQRCSNSLLLQVLLVHKVCMLLFFISKLIISPNYRCDQPPYNFIHEPDDGLKCVICLDVAKDPLQHAECGRLFCGECIAKYGKEKPCAHCRTQGSEFYPDKRSKL